MAIGELLPFLLIAVVFWFLIIRPQRRRQAEAQATRRAAVPGVRVMLTSGILGTIVENSDERTLVEISDGVVVEVAKAAIGHVLPEDDEPETADDGYGPQDTDQDEPGDAAAPKEN
jgi:preprotein translocase subunit YajC